MEDRQIVALYLARSETAIAETASKYGSYCHSIANRILDCAEDSEECVNDAFWKLWNAIPPHEPENLGTFLGKITRNLALDRYEHRSAAKRGGGQVPLALEELSGCLPGQSGELTDTLALTEALNRFLEGLSSTARRIFLLRYWQMLSVDEIARKLSVSQSKVKMTLHRTRNSLKKFLEKEDLG